MTGQRKKIKIKKIVSETKDCKTFVLETIDGTPILYKAGQFLTFIFDTPFGEQRRNYSFSSSPDWDEPVSITIKRITNGVFSRQLVDHTRKDDQFITIGASGFFTLPAGMKKYDQLFLMAAGSGITPVFSLLKTVLKKIPHTQVVLIYSNRSLSDTIFLKELRQLEQQYLHRLKIEWLFSNIFDRTKARLGNWLLGELIKKYAVVPLNSCLFYLCGPLDYMRVITITLLSAGANPANIRKEEFVITEPRVSLQPPDTQTRQVTIILDNKQHRFNSTFPQTILRAANEANIELPYSCQIGRCGACAAVCKQGNVWMKYNEVLTDDDLRRARVLTCTGYPVYGDVVLNFDEI
jgi:ring-1,2-phenylacetyl-CoA epoxidase subunit PaaE